MSFCYGMPTLLENSSLEENLSLCRELGLDFLELNMNLPEYQPDAIDVSDAKRLFRQYGKYPTIHLDEKLNVCEFNKAVADAYLNTVLRTIAIAKELGAPIINMHMADGVFFKLPDKKVWLYDKYRDQYMDRLRFFRDACAETISGDARTAAADACKAADDVCSVNNACAETISGDEIKICVENCATYQAFQRDGVDLLLESPCFALTYDIGHDFCAGNGNFEFIMRRADRLTHMHIHDAKDARNHLALGAGVIDIPAKLALAKKHDCRCVLETKTSDSLRKSVEYIQSYCSRRNADRLPRRVGHDSQ